MFRLLHRTSLNQLAIGLYRTDANLADTAADRSHEEILAFLNGNESDSELDQ